MPGHAQAPPDRGCLGMPRHAQAPPGRKMPGHPWVWIPSGIYTGLVGEGADFAIRLSPKIVPGGEVGFGLRQIANSAASPPNPV